MPADTQLNCLRTISAQLLSVAEELEEQVKGGPKELSLALCERNQPLLLALAEAEYWSRRKRKEYLPEDLLGEPVWDILLDLFIHEAKRRRTCVTNACMAAQVPEATALRCLNVLCDRGLVRRVPAEHDKRIVYRVDRSRAARHRFMFAVPQNSAGLSSTCTRFARSRSPPMSM